MRFSVIIPLYNKALYVRKALESVSVQTFQDYELIVVDDGSTDSSFEIAKDFLQEKAIAYQLLHQENAGVSSARNKGVAASCGDYVCFLDADDWWAPTYLKSMDLLIRDFPDAGIYGINYYIEKGGKRNKAILGESRGYIDYLRVYTEMRMPLTSSTVAIPRHVFDEYGGFRPHLKLGEDFDLWIRIALNHKVAFLNDPLAVYFQDVDPSWRGSGHLVSPSHHMLWNLDYLEEEEYKNPDYKRLIDELRTYSLMKYYLSDEFREEAKIELEKVDWTKQPKKYRLLYELPIPILKMRVAFLTVGSRVKHLFSRGL